MRKEKLGTQRGIALHGARASEWLETRGWNTISPNPQVFADTFDARRYSYSRTWLPTGEYVKPPSRSSSTSDRVVVLLLVEGEAEIGLDHRPSPFAVGDIAIAGEDSSVSLTASRPIALYEIVTDYNRLGLERYAVPRTSGPHAASSDYWPALTTLLNHVLNSSITADDLGISSIRTAVDNLLLAAIKESSTMQERRRATHEHKLLREARQIIREKAHSPSLTVARLAVETRVSRAHLHRLFASVNSTPLAEIRAARVELARLQLSEAAGDRDADLDAIARRSGFSSVSTMQRALASSSLR